MISLKSVISLLRPHQYLKNLFIFVPLFFAVKFTNLNLLISDLIIFLAFSFLASAVYIFNDIYDIKEDIKHPQKRNRPLPAKKISIQTAYTIMLCLMIISFSIAFFYSKIMILLFLLYLGLNPAYTIKLKHVAILDVTVIAIGFIIRLFVGSYATGISLSMWIILVTFLLAMFLALAKRRDDLLIYLDTGKKMRKAIDGYNFEIINNSMVIMATVTIVAYIMYTVSPEIKLYFHSDKIYLTVIFVILGVLRYLQITFLHQKSGSPTEILLKDRFLIICILLWILSFIILMMLEKHLIIF